MNGKFQRSSTSEDLHMIIAVGAWHGRGTAGSRTLAEGKVA